MKSQVIKIQEIELEERKELVKKEEKKGTEMREYIRNQYNEKRWKETKEKLKGIEINELKIRRTNIEEWYRKINSMKVEEKISKKIKSKRTRKKRESIKSKNKKWMKEETCEMIEDESDKWYAKNLVDSQLLIIEEERKRKRKCSKEIMEREEIERKEKEWKIYAIEREIRREKTEWREGFARIKIEKKESKEWKEREKIIRKKIRIQELKEELQIEEMTNRERIHREEREQRIELKRLNEKGSWKCAGLRKKCKWWNKLRINKSIIPESEEGVKLKKETMEEMKILRQRTIPVTWFGEEMRYSNNEEVKSKKYALSIGNLENRAIWLEKERENVTMLGVGHKMNSYRGLGEEIKEFKNFIKGKIIWIDTLNKDLQDKKKWLPERNGEIPRKWPIVIIDRKDLEKIEENIEEIEILLGYEWKRTIIEKEEEIITKKGKKKENKVIKIGEWQGAGKNKYKWMGKTMEKEKWSVEEEGVVDKKKKGKGLVNRGLTNNDKNTIWELEGKWIDKVEWEKEIRNTDRELEYKKYGSPNIWTVWLKARNGWWGPKGNEPNEETTEILYRMNNTINIKKAHMKLYFWNNNGISLRAKLIKVPKIGEEILANYEIVENSKENGSEEIENRKRKKDDEEDDTSEDDSESERKQDKRKKNNSKKEDTNLNKNSDNEKRDHRTRQRLMPGANNHDSDKGYRPRQIVTDVTVTDATMDATNATATHATVTDVTTTATDAATTHATAIEAYTTATDVTATHTTVIDISTTETDVITTEIEIRPQR